MPVNPYPLIKYNGTEAIFTIIQRIQLSNFLLAINHIAANAAPVVKVSKKGVTFFISLKIPVDKCCQAY